MAAVEVIRYVDPDTTGGSGTTWSNSYNSIVAWEAAEQKNLVTSSQYMTVYCRCSSGTADINELVINGWGLSSNCNIRIIADNTIGYWNTTSYRIISINSTGNAHYCAEPFIYTKNMQLQSSNTHVCFYSTKGSSYTFERCILKGNNSRTYNQLINPNNINSGVVNILNCVFYDSTGTGMSAIGIGGSTTTNFYIYNNTIINCTRGIQLYPCQSYYIKNNRISTTNKGFFTTIASSFVADDSICNYNYITENSSLYNALGTNGGYNKTFTYISSGISNFTPTTSDACIDMGTNLTTDAYMPFNTDISGNPRGLTWDIGSHELPNIITLNAGIEIILDNSALINIIGKMSGNVNITNDISGITNILQSIIGNSDITIDNSALINIIGKMSGNDNITNDISGITNILQSIIGNSDITIDDSALISLLLLLNGGSEFRIDSSGEILNLSDVMMEIKRLGTITFSDKNYGTITLNTKQSGTVKI